MVPALIIHAPTSPLSSRSRHWSSKPERLNDTSCFISDSRRWIATPWWAPCLAMKTTEYGHGHRRTFLACCIWLVSLTSRKSALFAVVCSDVKREPRSNRVDVAKCRIALGVPSSCPQNGSQDSKKPWENSKSPRESKSLSFEELNCKHSLCTILQKEGRSNPAFSAIHSPYVSQAVNSSSSMG